MKKISFIISYIGKDQWDRGLGGWKCPALKIPTTNIDAIYVDGKIVDSVKYTVDPALEVIRWSDHNPPGEISVSISLNEPLVPESEVVKANKRATDYQAQALKWEKYKVILPFLGIILGAIIGLVSEHPELLGIGRNVTSESRNLLEEMDLSVWLYNSNDTFEINRDSEVIIDAKNSKETTNSVEKKERLNLKFTIPDTLFVKYTGFKFSFGSGFYEKLGEEKTFLSPTSDWVATVKDGEYYIKKYSRIMNFSINYN